jgi:cytoskeleton protein RodZ
MPTEPLLKAADELETTEQSSDALTAGDILQQERLRQGLLEKEVADQLRIYTHYVKALESNSYEKLPGAVFTKGYLKSYALLLGLDVEDLMSRYDELTHQQDAESAQERRPLTALKKKDCNKPLVIVSLIIFVTGFLGLWLANSCFSEESLSDVPAIVESAEGAQKIRPALSQVNESQVTTPPQLTLEVETEENSAPTDQSTITPSLEELSVIASEPLVEVDLDSNVDSSSAVISETSGSQGSPNLEDLASALQALRAEQAAGAEASGQPRVITIEAIGSDLLRISFIGESWIEVNDSESQQIYRDIREAGDVLEITGSAPFNILLGDAPFISMSLNGDEIDLSADIRIDNSARLTVGL